MKQLLFIAILFSPLVIKAQSRQDTLFLGNLVIHHYQPKIDSVVIEMIILKRNYPNLEDRFDEMLVEVLIMEGDANGVLSRIGCKRRVDAKNVFKQLRK